MIGWLDAGAGASGDMLLGALVDAGVPQEVLQASLDPLELGLTVAVERVTRAGLAAAKASVLAGGRSAEEAGQEHRHLSDVRALLSRLPEASAPLAVFERLAAAEAAVHGVTPEEVAFHEVGALDAIGDVVAVCAGLRHLGLQALTCSTVALGSGRTRGAHGPLPVPVPAVLHLLAGAPVEAGPSPYESTTPTGAALLATLVTDWGPLPAMRPVSIGYGAGGRDPEEVCNAVRLVIGSPAEGTTDELVLEANVDDLDPRVWPVVLQRLLAAGASDAWLTPILMKKGRPAHALSVLCPPSAAESLRALVFRETTTLGVRETPVRKHALERTFTTVVVDGQQVQVKQGWYDGAVVTSTPEWDDVVRAAEALGRPVEEVLRAVRRGP